MHEMAQQIRLHFAEMYKHPVLQEWANQVGVEVPDDLIKNTLDIELVNESDYFLLMDDLKPAPNSTMVERIQHYVATDQYDKGAALAALGDWLEDCAAPELTFCIEGFE